MPEPSDRERLKMVELDPWVARTKLVRVLELKGEVHFKCASCFATKTWRLDVMLGRARTLLNCTFEEIQRRTPCPRCGAGMPAITVSGPIDAGPLAEQYRWEVISTLVDAGLSPTDYGYGWAPPKSGR